MNEERTYNGEGNHEHKAEGNQHVTIKTFEMFGVKVDDEIVAPNTAHDRKAHIVLRNGEVMVLKTKGDWTIKIEDLPNRGETPDGESMTEVLSIGELSMYERLRAEMLGAISRYAEEKGMDTFDEEEQNLDFEEDDENLIDTPYEYKVLQDEYLASRPQDELPLKQEEKEVKQDTPEPEEVSA